MTIDSDVLIRVTDWGAAEGEMASYSLSLDLQRRAGRGQLTSVESPVLSYVQRILEQFIGCALERGYHARVDVARLLEREGSWPRWATNVEQLNVLLRGVIHRDPSVYPVSVWLIPEQCDRASEAVEEFRIHRFDTDLYHEILALDVIRISVEGSYCDIVSRESLGIRVLDWMRLAIAVAHPAQEVYWVNFGE